MTRPPNINAWVNFKTHSNEAYSYLLNLCGRLMRDTSFQQQANFITDSISAAVANRREADKSEIFKALGDTKSIILRTMSVVPSLQSESKEVNVECEFIPLTIQSANASVNDNIQLQLLKILERIDKKLDSSSQPPPNKQPLNCVTLDFIVGCMVLETIKESEDELKDKCHAQNTVNPEIILDTVSAFL